MEVIRLPFSGLNSKTSHMAHSMLFLFLPFCCRRWPYPTRQRRLHMEEGWIPELLSGREPSTTHPGHLLGIITWVWNKITLCLSRHTLSVYCSSLACTKGYNCVSIKCMDIFPLWSSISTIIYIWIHTIRPIEVYCVIDIYIVYKDCSL